MDSSLAKDSDFSEAYEDDEGDWLHRTSLGPRGCIFLDAQRGCRLHTTGLKPSVCIAVPRNIAEADEMAADAMLPCRPAWRSFG